jgi:indolepyruvate ferredoxin oxidoreductase
LIVDYMKTVDDVIAKLSSDNYETAVDLASVPEHIRGFGHVKHQHFAEAKKREAELWEKFRNPKVGIASKEIRIKVAA